MSSGRRQEHGTPEIQRGSSRLVGKRIKKWQARWREDVITPEGQTKRVLRKELIGTLKEFPTRRLPEREMEHRLSPINRLDYRPKRPSTFEEFAELWQKRVASQYKPSMQATMRSHLRTHLIPKLGGKSVGNIDAFEIQDFISGIRVKRSKNDCKPVLPPSGKTVKNLISTLSLMHTSAVAWNLTDRDWLTGVVLPEWIKPDARHFTLAEARQVINTASEPFKTFFWIIAETGIRLGEACALRPCDFRLDAQVVVIRRSAWRSVPRRQYEGEATAYLRSVIGTGRPSAAVNGWQARGRIPVPAGRRDGMAGRSRGPRPP